MLFCQPVSTVWVFSLSVQQFLWFSCSFLEEFEQIISWRLPFGVGTPLLGNPWSATGIQLWIVCFLIGWYPGKILCRCTSKNSQMRSYLLDIFWFIVLFHAIIVCWQCQHHCHCLWAALLITVLTMKTQTFEEKDKLVQE